MKDDNKKKTMMFTIIAIAALLVAVVGATFAYFSANQSGTGSVSASAATSRRDLIVVSGTSGALAITTDNELMAQPNANNNTPKYTATTESDPSGKITISITAGTGVAECKYDLVYKASDANHVFPGTTVSGVLAPREFTITGVGKVGNTTVNSIAETSLSTCDNTTGCVLNGNTKLTSSGDTTGTTEVWDFTINFYNLTADQNTLENRSFGGVVTVENLECYNNSVSNTNPENVKTTESQSGGNQQQEQGSASTFQTLSGNISATSNDHVTWTYDEDGVLTISGTGAMRDCNTEERNTIPQEIMRAWLLEKDVFTEAMSNEDKDNILWYAVFLIQNSTFFLSENGGSFGSYEDWEDMFINEGLGYVEAEIDQESLISTISDGFPQITSIVIESGVTSIGDMAFMDAGYIGTVTIPASVQSIGEAIFGFNGLTHATILGTPEVVDSAFDYCGLQSSDDITTSLDTSSWRFATP